MVKQNQEAVGYARQGEHGQCSRWMYEYDFGDCWRHEVLFEGFPPIDPKAKPPLCLEGERAWQ